MTDCAVPLVLLPPRLQKIEVGGLFWGIWPGREATRADTPVMFSLCQFDALD